MRRPKLFHDPDAIIYRYVGAEAREATLKAQVSRVEDVLDGCPVRLDGVVRAGDELLESPITGTQCVAYSSWVELMPYFPTVLPRWRQKLHFAECRSASFTLEDHGAPVQIGGSNVELSARIEYAEILKYSELDARQWAFLNRREGWRDRWAYGCCLYEAVLTPGMRAAVLGTCQVLGGPEADGTAFREVSRIVSVRGTARHPTRIAMLPVGGDVYLEQKTI